MTETGNQELKALERKLRSRIASSSTEENSTTKIECEKCRDIGWFRHVNERGYESMEPCQCTLVKNTKRIIAGSGISDAFKNLTFNDFKIEHKPKLIRFAKKSAMQYAKDFEEVESSRHNSMGIFGTVGSGKTHLAVAIANHFLSQGIQVRYMEYQAEVGQLKRNRFDDEGYNRLISPFLNCRVLLLDDLYKGGINKGELNALELQIIYEIINHRYLKKKPLIVTSEYRADEILALDEAVGSRIMEMCYGHIIVMEEVENHRIFK